MNSASPEKSAGSKSQLLIIISVCLMVTLWNYWPSLREMYDRWTSDPQYSHCFFVPLFSVFLLWRNKSSFVWSEAWPFPMGLVLVMLGLGLKFVGSFMYVQFFEQVSILIVLLGLVYFFLGGNGCRWAWPAVLFLFFAIPLPYSVQNALGLPLQRMATIASTFLMQTFGIPAVSEGNIITVNEMKIGVNEACNGLGMLITFFALSTAVAMLSKRPGLDRIVVFLSAAPIAILANIIRITATGVCAFVSGPELAKKVFHDLAGWFMMPLALVLLYFVLWYMQRLLLDPRIFDHNKEVRSTVTA